MSGKCLAREAQICLHFSYLVAQFSRLGCHLSKPTQIKLFVRNIEYKPNLFLHLNTEKIRAIESYFSNVQI